MAQKYVFDPIGFVIATVITFLFVGFIFHWFDGIIAFFWLLIRVIAVILIIGIVIYIIYYFINRSKYGVLLGKNIRQWMPKKNDQNIKTYNDQLPFKSSFPTQSPKSIERTPSEPQKIIFPPQSPPLPKSPLQPKNLPNITIEDIDKMEGTEFELYLKKLFEKMGYSVEKTPNTSDHGADLILSKSGEKIAVQAKNWKNSVNNKAIQEVHTSLIVYKAQRGMVVSSSDFTSGAIILADLVRVELWNRDNLIEMMDRYPVSR